MAKLLKELYDENYINILSNNIINIYFSFDKNNFIASIFNDNWKDKKLKQRMRHISNALYVFLPNNYKESISILKNTFLKMNTKYSLENMIFQDFVEVYGLEDFKTSMNALECFTINSSSEFAIRQFILKYPNETIEKMQLWAIDKNEHIRRLASEGCRPRLPWAIALSKFKQNPKEILNILEILKDDESLYVRKSVANSLNDISKDNPEILKDITKNWIGINKNRDWILKHGCRTLLKNGDKEILDLFGFKENNNIFIDDFVLSKKLKMGENLTFSFMLKSSESLGKLRIEYSIEFLRLNNKYAKKVFKISEGIYDKESKSISKYYSFKPISTRKYYKGIHKLSIIINGIVLERKEFIVL
ncbi:MAG: DNA alkylation repair protein [Epsilonproteobacteria bacterium]|nr:MAG: DNA alkylation repair protein [Campylobacterota bacterium]